MTLDKKYIIALDQGTTSSRALLVDCSGEIVGMEQQEFPQIYPASGWVEHNPKDILNTQLTVFKNLLVTKNISINQISAIGITNQRETTIVWDKRTGEPIYNAIVWQDKRTASICEELKEKGLTDYVKKNTGLVIDSYFSSTKIKWILDHVAGAKEKAAQGHLLFGEKCTLQIIPMHQDL